MTFAAYFGVVFMCFSKFGQENGSEVIITVEEQTENENEEEPDFIVPAGNPNLYPRESTGYLIALLAGICAGTAYTIVRKMNQTMHYIYSAFYNGLAGIPFFIVLYFINPDSLSFKTYTWASVGLMLLGATGDLIGQVCMSMAYRYEDASRIGPINYFMIVF